MKKLILIFLFGIFLFSLSGIDACDERNEFTIGEDIEICTGLCEYQNASNSSQYIACDDSVSCNLTATYSNKTSLVSRVAMTRDADIFKYNISSILGNITSDEEGIYEGLIDCSGDQVTSNVNFHFSISASSTAIPTSEKVSSLVSPPEPLVIEEVEEPDKNLNSMTIALWVLVLLIVVIIISLLVYWIIK